MKTRRNIGFGSLLSHAANAGVAVSSGLAIVDRYQRIDERKKKRTMRKSSRNPYSAQINLPADIIDRLGQDRINEILDTPEPVETLRMLAAQALVEDDYYAVADYERLIAILSAGGEIDTEATETNPIFLEDETAYLDRMGGQWELFTYSEGRRYKIKSSYSRGEIESWARKHHYRIIDITKNPSYTVHVESPAVRESVEVKGPFLTTGGALRKGKGKLRHAAKAHPKWSVERNPLVQMAAIANHNNVITWVRDDSKDDYLQLEGMYDTGARVVLDLPDGYNPAFAATLHHETLKQIQEGAIIRQAEMINENPSRKRGRHGLTKAVLINPLSKRFEKLYEIEQDLRNALASAEYHNETARATAIKKQIERVYELRKREEARIDKGRRNGLPEISSSVKSQLNKVSRMFHGERNRHHGKLRTVEISKHVNARHFTRNGSLPYVKLLRDVNGKHAHPKHACEECCIEFNPNTSFVGMTANKRIQLMGNGVKAAGKRMRASLLRKHRNGELEAEENLVLTGTPETDAIDLGPVDVLWYQTDEKHSDSEVPPLVNYYHNHGEETGRIEDKPHLILDEEGMFYLKGGNYTVTEAGIEN